MYRERMPIQLLAYLRLARLTDPALLAKVRSHAHLPLSACCTPCHERMPCTPGESRGSALARANETPKQLQLAEGSAANDALGCHAGDL